MTIDGKKDSHGNPLSPSISNVIAITYDLCISQCGGSREPFQWSIFSQQFSLWLLPWLALVSQLPFGANDKLDNLESMLLTLGSPTLAAYSLTLTVLNGQWIAQLFSNYRYPNVKKCCVNIEQLAAVSPLSWHRQCTPHIAYHAPTKRWVVGRTSGLAWLHTYLVHICSHIDRMGDHHVCIHYFAQNIQNETLNSNGGLIESL